MTTTAASIEVRPINPEELDEFAFVTHTTLATHSNEGFNDPMTEMRPEWTLCVFEDGAMATSFAAWPFSMRWNGERIHAAGVTAVGTLPHKRRRGFLSRAMTTAFGVYRDAQQPVAILHASQAAIYQRYGYAIISAVQDYLVDPREISFVGKRETPGTVRLSDKNELNLLKQLYRAYAEPRTGLLHRGNALWEAGPLDEHDKKTGPAYAAIYEEDGEPQGYAIYATRAGDERRIADRNHVVTLRELMALTPAAYVALWEHIAAQDLADRIIYKRAPAEDLLCHMLQEPRRLNATAHDDVLLRVVDTKAALSTRPYAEAGQVTFELFDDRCDWNSGTWTLDSDGARGELTPSSSAPQFALGPRALSALASGARSATELYRQGDMETSEPESLRRWDHLFETAYKPYCADMF